jgi:sucrose-6-phosphate hydrolase SacC (GH32 family)
VLDLHMADFRDPSVSWDNSQHHWVMAVSLPKEHKVRFYASPDLKDWKLLSEFGPEGDTAGDWECPDLLHVPAANGKGDGTWTLKVGLNPGAPQGGSGEQYFLGTFDGTHFTVSRTPGAHGWTNYGKDDYCAISYNGLTTTSPHGSCSFEFQDILPRALKQRGLVLTDAMHDPESGRRLVRSMPSTDVSIALKAAWHRNGQREWALGSSAQVADLRAARRWVVGQGIFQRQIAEDGDFAA